MFAQLLITIGFTWLVAEVLCRALFDRSALGALGELFGPEPRSVATSDAVAEPHPDLTRLLRERRAELASARSRLELASQASDVTRELASVEDELAEVEERLAQLERERGGHPSG